MPSRYRNRPGRPAGPNPSRESCGSLRCLAGPRSTAVDVGAEILRGRPRIIVDSRVVTYKSPCPSPPGRLEEKYSVSPSSRELRRIIAESESVDRGAQILGRTKRLGGRLTRRDVDVLIELAEAVQARGAEKKRQTILGERGPSLEVRCIDERADVNGQVVTQSGTGRAIGRPLRSGLARRGREVQAPQSRSAAQLFFPEPA